MKPGEQKLRLVLTAHEIEWREMRRASVLECASPLALLAVVLKAAEGGRSPRALAELPCPLTHISPIG
jgi:hypothetical protein